MTLDTESYIETGRSWRDLPEEPPFGDPLDPVAMPDVAQVVAAPAPASPKWPWVLGAGVFALALLALLLWSPWSSDADDAPFVPPVTEAPGEDPVDPSESQVPAVPSEPSEGESGADRALPPVGEEPVADVATALLPSVVQIESRGGVGSGFIYDESGAIFTAAHVVSGSNDVTVRLSDGRTVAGVVLGRDDTQDVAVVDIDADEITAAPLAVGSEIRVGQTAIAVGSPFGLERTVTAGIVSALDRSLSINGRQIQGLIQTDAAINQGNSGGPLADGDGRVFGINVAIATASGGSNGVGFAVPIDRALEIAEGFDGQAPPVPDQGSSPLDDLLGGTPFADPFGPGSPLDDLLNGFDLDDFGLNLDDPLSMLPEELQDLFGTFGLDSFDLEDPLGSLDSFGLGDSTGSPLFDVGDLPTGYRISDTRTSSTDGTAQQVTTLSGPDGTVTVRATEGAGAGTLADAAAGDVVSLRGASGRLDETERSIRLTWAENDVLVVEIIAPAALGARSAIAIAEGLEI